MSCVLKVAGRTLNVDRLVEECGLPEIAKHHRLEQFEEGDVPDGKHYSYVAVTVSNADMDSVLEQISDTVLYLTTNFLDISFLTAFDGVEYAVLHFLVQLQSMSEDHFDQKIYFQKDLLELCGSLGLGIEVALVDCS